MVLNCRQVGRRLRERLAVAAAELRDVLYAEDGAPERGTSFAELEAVGSAVGLELARPTLEQPAEEQAAQMPREAMEMPGDSRFNSPAASVGPS
jgi:hypothetical protein